MTDIAAEQHQRFLRTPPSDEQLHVVARYVGARGAVMRVRRLKGGIASAVHRVDYSDGTRVVVRRFNASLAWHDQKRVEREALLLDSLADTPVPAPRLLFADARGSETGDPLLVLSLLPGRVIDPPGDAAWARSLASALAIVHEQVPPFEAEPWVRFWEDHDLPSSLADVPRAAEVWSAIEGVRSALVGEPLVFAHNDFHPGNTLWSRGRVTGVVDWPLAGWGNASYDAAYCAFDAALSKGRLVGERVLRAYESVAGRGVHDGWRLVVATRALDELDDWVDAYVGIGTQVTVRQVRARFDAWVDDARRRVG